MKNWYGHPIDITTIKKSLQVIWYEHRQPYPPPTYLPNKPSTYQSIYLPTHPPTYLLMDHLNGNPPTHDPPTYLYI
jgi:hypothetical protein